MNILLPVDEQYVDVNGKPKRGAPYEVKLNNFINKANTKYNWKYDYNKVQWVDSFTQVTIVCPRHGDFKQKPADHMNSKHGCPLCGHNKLNNHPSKKLLEAVIAEATEAHNGYYTYEHLEYKSMNDQGMITCPVHGDYPMSIKAHLRGDGKCPQCYRRNTGFYSQGYFANHPEQKSILGKLYFVKIYNDAEAFYKVGITKHGAYHRFYVDEKLPYSLEIIKEVEMPLYDAYCKEQMLLEQYRDYYITPLIDFPGKTECLTIDIRDEI